MGKAFLILNQILGRLYTNETSNLKKGKGSENCSGKGKNRRRRRKNPGYTLGNG
jgi:hypothetical protein